MEFACLTENCLMKTGKSKYTWNQEYYSEFAIALKAKRPELIVVNDKAALGFLTQKYISLALCRGGIYYWEGIPCLIIDDIFKLKSTRIGAWILLNDLGKLKRWANGNQRKEPAFNYRVCRTVSDVRELLATISESFVATVDIETSGVTQTCVGYTCWENTGKITTFVVPFVDTTQADGCFWRTEEEEIEVWHLLRRINASSAVKAFQNGIYDNAYFVRDRIPAYNWTADTLHLFHSIWTEAPKRLDFISSIAMDYYRYWKDEGKEDAKEDLKGGAVPRSTQGLENYWLYNALDCYNTMMDLRFLTALITHPSMDWALVNYRNEMMQQTGPALNMSMRGIKCDAKMKSDLAMKLAEESFDANEILLQMVGDPEFNCQSPQQVAELLYDVLKVKPVKKGKQARGTGEPILKMVQTQHPLYDIIIDQIWKKKKPANNNSKYGAGLQLLKGRFMYQISASTTDTARYASKGHQFWLGTNIQNMPEPMRVMLEADPGYVLFDIDYAQSDAYFTAFSSGDKQFIANMLSPDDTHCVHAAHFFKKDFNELVRAKKAKEEWCVHKIKGVRSITKRVVYGANYKMTAYTLYMTMGKHAAVSAGVALGYEEAPTWTDQQLIYLCDMLLKAYFQLYPELEPWLEEELQKAARNGNKAACCGGRVRIFFGDLLHDEKLQKEFAANWGQGGTAMNINKAVERIFYEHRFDLVEDLPMEVPMTLEDAGVMTLFQVHDSLVGQVPEDKLWLIPLIQNAMANECEIYGRKFTVPTEAQVGRGWGKRMIDWDEDGSTSLIDIDKHETSWQIQRVKEKRNVG